jgi:hypothetical protein
MPGDGSFLAGGDYANLDRTRTGADNVNGPVICVRIEFKAQPTQSVADQRAHFDRVLAEDCATAEMGDNGSFAGERWRDLPQPPRNEFVTKAMETEPAYVALLIISRYR